MNDSRTKGDEPAAVSAQDVGEILDIMPHIVLAAKTTKTMLLAAGWSDDTIATIEDFARLSREASRERVVAVLEDVAQRIAPAQTVATVSV